ncbi:hypothetical protein [Tatumella saanichensis]|uniref:hypothetical protein n=1 Tax=Tatumella saanichensis TaxID=480813 RepID=UPI0004A32445|nr:hypothetical protein [Tatumella saanichensis]
MKKMMKSMLTLPLAGLFMTYAMAADNTTDVQEPVTTDTTPYYYSLSDTSGGVFNYIKTKYHQGTSDNYDILLVGDSLTADQALKSTVLQALNSGKEVIFDGNSGGKKATQLANDVIGSTLDADAIMFKTAPTGDGYLMTPVELSTADYSTDSLSDEKTTTSAISENTPDAIFQ